MEEITSHRFQLTQPNLLTNMITARCSKVLHLLLYIVYLISYHCPSSTAYINQMQENLHALKLELEKGTIGTNVSEDGKARLETCVMSCVATFVFGEANQVSLVAILNFSHVTLTRLSLQDTRDTALNLQSSISFCSKTQKSLS